MIRTFASFRWDLPLAEDEEPPFAETHVRGLIENLRACGLRASTPEDMEYAWNFDCSLEHGSMWCQLGFVEDPNLWLLACYPTRGLVGWLFVRTAVWEAEQQQFADKVDQGLRSEPHVNDIRWYTEQEWDRVGVDVHGSEG